MYAIPGTNRSNPVDVQPALAVVHGAPAATAPGPRTVAAVLAQTQVEAVLDELDRELVGLKPVKQRIRDIAALLVIESCAKGWGCKANNLRCTCASVATPAPERPPWPCEWRRSCTVWAMCAKAMW